MQNELVSVSKLFNEKLFRIPDYQRGYAWTQVQLEDFWSDLSQISEDSNHYTGVLTLEPVPLSISNRWDEDLWIINSKSYTPFYVVDGQQRLTTIVVLLQCITERLKDAEAKINYTSRSEIQKKYLFESRDEGVSRSYIFGYEKDNPSYEYLKTKVFGERSPSDRQEETVYTNNLSNAKAFFSSRLESLSLQEIEIVFRKVTQKLLFNIFSISEEVDVCVAFETMNNRGKPLSYLELLKNRLIYLSIKLDVEPSESQKLRVVVNDSWKTIYHNLGRNKHEPLDDDFFLRTHHFVNFVDPAPKRADDEDGRRRQIRLSRAIDQPEYRNLLNEIFTLSSVFESRASDATADAKTLHRIHAYAMSLQDAVKVWYSINNPAVTFDPSMPDFWLLKIKKIAVNRVYPILLAVMQNQAADAEKVLALRAVERLLFLEKITSSYYDRELVFSDLLSAAIRLHRGEIAVADLTSEISDIVKMVATSEWGLKQIREALRVRNYYTWRAIHYFLYEYNLSLQLVSKTEREKIDWSVFVENERDYESIEHIYPQRAQTTYWRENFKGLKQNQRELLKNVVGNLLPLSRKKNSSLSNASFSEKKHGRSGIVGYAYGSYAENEVATEYEDWTPQAILDRSLRLLDFMEKRWEIPLGKDDEKIELLGLTFVRPAGRLKRSHGEKDMPAKSRSSRRKG